MCTAIKQMVNKDQLRGKAEGITLGISVADERYIGNLELYDFIIEDI